MDGELKQYLIAMESRLEANITRLEALSSGVEIRLDAKIEKVETTLLTEFHKWASPTEARQRTVSAALRALDMEMEALTDRVQKLEGGRQ